MGEVYRARDWRWRSLNPLIGVVGSVECEWMTEVGGDVHSIRSPIRRKAAR
jgi:hypothetical protein